MCVKYQGKTSSHDQYTLKKNEGQEGKTGPEYG
jgi:hypothetical protein